MAKQKIEMQELPAGVFTFDEVGKLITGSLYGKLLAITSVDSYNNRLKDFPLTVIDLKEVPDLVLTQNDVFLNIEDFSNCDQLTKDDESLQCFFEGKQYLVLFDPKTGERISWR